MVAIFKSDSVHLEKKKKDVFTMKIQWEGPTKSFWVNFPLQKMDIVKQQFDGKNKLYTIEAKSIVTLKTFLDKETVEYKVALYMLEDLGNQFRTLDSFRIGVPFLNIEDIIVVHNKNNKIYFFYMNDEKIFTLNNYSMMNIDKIFEKSKFISPEFEKITSLPATLHSNSIAYSLAILVIFCYLGKYVNLENKNEILAPLYYTKLYWALQRMLEAEPSDRFTLVI
jgi:hypothetical protein